MTTKVGQRDWWVKWYPYNAGDQSAKKDVCGSH
jgi:hypothetical protein